MVYSQARDLLVSISVQSPAPLNQLFDVNFTITNLAGTQRDLQLQLNPHWLSDERIPPHPSQSKDSAHHDPPASSLLCLEKSANIGVLDGYSSTSLNLPFIALDEGIFQIDKIQIIDKSSHQISHMVEPCEIFVREQLPKD